MADDSLNAELSAMQGIAITLHRLDQPTRARVLHWILERFQTDAAFVAGAATDGSAADFELRAVPPADDEALSVGSLTDLFEPDVPALPQPPGGPPQSITGMLQDLVAEFQDLAREWNGSESRPADKHDAKPRLPIAS